MRWLRAVFDARRFDLGTVPKAPGLFYSVTLTTTPRAGRPKPRGPGATALRHERGHDTWIGLRGSCSRSKPIKPLRAERRVKAA